MHRIHREETPLLTIVLHRPNRTNILLTLTQKHTKPKKQHQI